MNFNAVKFFDNNGNVLENNVKRVVFCCKYSDEKFHSGIITEKEYIEYNDKRVHSWKWKTNVCFVVELKKEITKTLMSLESNDINKIHLLFC